MSHPNTETRFELVIKIAKHDFTFVADEHRIAIVQTHAEGIGSMDARKVIDEAVALRELITDMITQARR